MIRFRYGKVLAYHLDLGVLTAMAQVWPHPVCREFFATELALKRAIESKLMLSLGAFED